MISPALVPAHGHSLCVNAPGQLLKVEVLDHVILGRPTAQRQKDFVSLRELGCFL